MKEAQPRAIYLKDYRAPDYWIDRTDLEFDLYEDQALVTATLHIRRNDEQSDSSPELILKGVDLELLGLRLDGRELCEGEYRLDPTELILPVTADRFVLEIKNRIRPQDNTSLEGLYKSNGLFCTQCEAERFRKITYYLDRPDVMSVFSTRIIADKQRYPVLLANGNDVERGDLDNGRHWVKWQDPFKKPSYLFALVAGDLAFIEEPFTTASGRQVTLKIFTEGHNIHKCDHAMVSLKKAMRWDEEVYGREYDLDIFMIVAVDHFNMGAMENKGLNIFNSACVLASPETATDSRYQRIEAIVAHEYFHNWSGNRVTCRDWFQLNLKEGFTVFRDSEFSADMNSRGVKRIEDVAILRTVQFAEDASPMAHPVRPESYMEIGNFYTVTIYEKGAEVVRMIHALLGAETFRKGSDLYFARHDGQAVTCEDFVRAMEDASGRDLGQFRRWYSQSGTPVLKVSDHYDAASGDYQLTIEQSCPATPGQDSKQPFHIPVRMALLDSRGQAMALNEQGDCEQMLEVTQAQQTILLRALAEKPLPSLLRGFSAPVRLEYPYSQNDLIFLMKHDSDSFNRWDAGQRLALAEINAQVAALARGETRAIDACLIDAFGHVLADNNLDRAVKAEMLQLPSGEAIAEQSAVIQPGLIHRARQQVRQAIAQAHHEQLYQLWRELDSNRPYQPEAGDIARRTLRNTCLGYLLTGDDPQWLALAQTQYEQASNMTDRFAALAGVVNARHQDAALIESLLADFLQRYRDDANVMDQWFSVQAGSAQRGTLARVQALMDHDCFDATSPNKVRALVGAFSQNMNQFHDDQGAGYQFLANLVLDYNRKNPQLAARLLKPLTRWKKYQPAQGQLMKSALESIRRVEPLSADVFEVVSKSL